MEGERLQPYEYHYFLDEAGDPSFFGKGKRMIIGTPGVSFCYLLGMVKFHSNLDSIRHAIIDLQQIVTQERYFRNIGSIGKKQQKNGFYFHATDDIPEVRMLFFKFLNSLDCSFEIVAGQKIPELYLEKHKENPHRFYADLLSHLLYNNLFGEGKIVLNIAAKGASTRLENLRSGLERAESRFSSFNPHIPLDHQVVFNVQNQTSEPLLNVADYFCWAVQRVFEKGETRYYDYLRDKIIWVVDLFNEVGLVRRAKIYTPEKPLTAKNKKSLHSI